MCTRAVSGLAHYFEEEGLASIIIALVREHAEKMKPPRALWVPFELGRPLGAPGNAAFQRKVLMAAFDLLNRPSGPLLEDFPEEAPGDVVARSESDEPWTCPVSFARKQEAREKTLVERVKEEIEELSPWYEKARGRRGRTMVGLSHMEMPQAVDFLAGFLNGGAPSVPPPHEFLHMAFKFTTEDIKVYYAESAWAQPGSPKRGDIEKWFWTQTEAGKFFIAVVEHAVCCGDRFTEGTAWGATVPATLKHLTKLPKEFKPLTPEDMESLRRNS